MHDPCTVAFSIRFPWQKKYASAITIWHKDPENINQPDVRRRDDACGWSWPNLNAKEVEYANRLIDNDLDNLRGFFGKWDEKNNFELDKMKADLKQCFRLFKGLHRPWWKHPRWHFWHWEIQIHVVAQFKRWAFSRCVSCGKGFTWGYSPTGFNWDSGGPRWFRSETDVYHSECIPELRKNP